MIAQALVLDDGTNAVAIIALDLVFAGRRADRRDAQDRAGADGDPARGGARECGAQSQRAEHLARRDDRWARRRPRLRALRDLAFPISSPAPSTRPGVIAGPARVGSGVGRAPGITVNRVRRERPVDDSVPVLRVDGEDGTSIAVVAGFRLPPDADGRTDPRVERRVPGAAAGGGRARDAGSRGPVPAGVRRRRRRLGLLVREPRGEAALLRGPRRARRGHGRRGARDAAGDHDDLPTPRLARRLEGARARAPQDPVHARRARGEDRGDRCAPGAELPGGVAGERAHGNVGTGLPAVLPALVVHDVRRHAASLGRAHSGRDPGARDRRRCDRRQPVRALQRVRHADPGAEPISRRPSRSATRTTTPGICPRARISISSPASRSTRSSTRTGTAGRTASRRRTSSAARSTA